MSNTPPSYPFTPDEFERLYVFKQAVSAGFYNDDLPEPLAGEQSLDVTAPDPESLAN